MLLQLAVGERDLIPLRLTGVGLRLLAAELRDQAAVARGGTGGGALRAALADRGGCGVGRAEALPLPDASADITADVATDSVATAVGGRVTTQREALLALGIADPGHEPRGELATLVRRGQVAELINPSGLGSFHWVLTPIGVDDPLT